MSPARIISFDAYRQSFVIDEGEDLLLSRSFKRLSAEEQESFNNIYVRGNQNGFNLVVLENSGTYNIAIVEKLRHFSLRRGFSQRIKVTKSPKDAFIDGLNEKTGIFETPQGTTIIPITKYELEKKYYVY